jgi:predicted alpha/beta superfamily hydrolase
MNMLDLNHIILTGDRTADVCLIQPIDHGEDTTLEEQLAAIRQRTDRPFLLCAVPVTDWNGDLSPWEAPPVFGKVPFGGHGSETLAAIENRLIPQLQRGCGAETFLLGGYSLAAFFALWACYETDAFAGVACASPSVWFPGWIEKAESGRPRTKSVYLSLGDREEKAKNRVMATVGDCIRRQHALLESDPNVETVLEWNEGNHFKDAPLRTAKAFAWLLDR